VKCCLAHRRGRAALVLPPRRSRQNRQRQPRQNVPAGPAPLVWSLFCPLPPLVPAGLLRPLGQLVVLAVRVQLRAVLHSSVAANKTENTGVPQNIEYIALFYSYLSAAYFHGSHFCLPLTCQCQASPITRAPTRSARAPEFAARDLTFDWWRASICTSTHTSQLIKALGVRHKTEPPPLLGGGRQGVLRLNTK